MEKSIIQGELWGKTPKGWAEIQEPMHLPLWNAMLNASNVGKGTTLLDIGCGGGGSSILAYNRGALVSGIDPAEGLLKFARKRVPSGDFRVGDMENLPFDDNSFDLVFAANAVQYSEDRINALKEFSRVCKPGGKIVAGLFAEPEKVEFNAVFKALGEIMQKPSSGGGPFELSMPGKFEALFEKAGLNVTQTGEINCPFHYPNFEVFWEGNVAAGPFQGMIKVVDEEILKESVKRATIIFLQANGEILIQPNIFKYVVAKI
jgi:SAM-dependent methyltransferase